MKMEDFFGSSKTKAHYRNTKRLPDELITKRDQIINIILAKERLYRNQPELRAKEILPYGYEKLLPYVKIKVTDPSIISVLRQNKFIINVEPSGYDLSNVHNTFINQNIQRSFGCHPHPAPTPLNPSDYSPFYHYQFNSKASWNYVDNGISNAWNSSAEGDGIGICVIDTGASDNQNNLGSQFTAGISTGRTIRREGKLPLPSPRPGRPAIGPQYPVHDLCGHGTGMAGLVAGPMAGDGNAVGIAYKANLLTIRAVNDVWINANEVDPVVNALIYAAYDADTKIISMSIGRLTDNLSIALATYYASIIQEKIIFAAAGTGAQLNTVIFPANLSSNLTLAITGVKDVLDAQGNTIGCSDCFYGPEVDFVTVMEKGSDTGSLTLANYSDTPKYTSGSSAATATAAGIAALVWSAYPNETKDQIIDRLKVSTKATPLNPILRGNTHGWGRINAHKAITW